MDADESQPDLTASKVPDLSGVPLGVLPALGREDDGRAPGFASSI